MECCTILPKEINDKSIEKYIDELREYKMGENCEEEKM